MIRIKWITTKLVGASFFRKNVKQKLLEVSIRMFFVHLRILIDVGTLQNIYEELSSNIGSATDGSRLWPPNRKQDKKLGIRFDVGQKFHDPTTNKWMRNVVLQLNADAENPGIKDAVGRNGSHAQRLIAQVPLNDDGTALDPSVTEETVRAELVDPLDGGF